MSRLLPLSVPQVGIYGLNKQNQDTNLPLGWATEASNLVFNERGTLESRKGLLAKHTGTYGTIKSIHAYIDANGVEITVFGSGTKLYKLVGTTVTDITGTAVATDGNWQFVTFNGTCVGYQSGHAPIVLTSATATFAPAGNNQYNGSMVCSALGRLWTVFNDVLYYSDLLINDFYPAGTGATFNIGAVDGDGVIDWDTSPTTLNPTGGTGYRKDDILTLDQVGSSYTATVRVDSVNAAGAIQTFTLSNTGYDYTAGAATTSIKINGEGAFDLSLYWPNGQDTAVAVREWNNLLLVFGKRSILVYGNPDDANNTMLIIESVTDAGCVARDSIQEVGNDMLFLSNGGVQSIGKLLEEKSVPLNDVSKNVKDYVVSLLAAESDPGLIKSTYSQKEGFYALSFPTSGKTVVFDISTRLEDSTFRCTEWTTGYTAMNTNYDSNVLLASGGVISDYTGWTDNASAYTINYEGVWNDFGEEVSVSTKIPKSIRVFAEGTDGDSVTVNLYYDYGSTPRAETTTISGGKIDTPVFGSGELVKVGFSSTINGSKKAFKKYNLFAKVGKF